MRRIATGLVIIAFLAVSVTMAGATYGGGSGGHDGGAAHIQYKKKKLCALIKWFYDYHHGWKSTSKVKTGYGWYTLGWLIKFCTDGDEDCDTKSWSKHSTYYGRNDGHHDDEGCQAPPDASCTATPSYVYVNKTVTFSGAGSSDPDGTISKYEWDLDGNGSYEKTGVSQTKSYTSTGTKTVKLRVTDNDGATSTSTCSVVVKTSTPPKPHCKYSPSPVYKNKSITFDGSGSSDPDGPIKKYEWDLDNNGSFETSSSGPTTSKSFPSTGSKSVKLKVTDAYGESATITVAVTVK